MKRVIDTLNEMSFDLPSDYHVATDKYDLVNGQGFYNRENYLSDDGKVISFFEIHRDPDEFIESYTSLSESYKKLTDKFELVSNFNLKLGEYLFPVFVIKGFQDKLIYTMQVFINCGDCMGCFMITINTFDSDIKALLKKEKVFADLVKILRTVK